MFTCFSGAPAWARAASEQPFGEPRRVLDADAARAEAAVRLGEQSALGRVVEVDALLVGEHELHLPHRIALARKLAHRDLDAPVGDRFPVDAVGSSTWALSDQSDSTS
jgi:hypothetical protein